MDDVTTMAPFNVKADRFEEFGFRVTGQLAIPGTSYAMIAEVFPNTAASKAGLRPGELISKVDGKRRSVIALIGLAKTQDRKWAELSAGKANVTWSFEVHAPGSKDRRTVVMEIPSPAPRWGSKVWAAPEGRTPAEVKEPGPLSARAREVLDNGIWTVLRAESFFGAQPRYIAPVLGYEWRVVQPSATRRIWVTQQRGRTEIILEHKSAELGHSLFLTSPSGALEKASCRPARKAKQEQAVSDDEVRARFEAELDFWLTKVGRVSGRWPFEPLAGKAEDIAITGKQGAETHASRSESFLKLPVANDGQRALFSDALGKIGMDEDRWAYTETSHAFGDDSVTTVRNDPSKPSHERAMLVAVNGKAPKAAHLQRWREEGHGAPAILGELPAFSSLVDLNDVRVFADETASIVFELPLKGTQSGFSSDKFQALFRVNKTQRAFEDVSIKLRGALRVAGVAKLTGAGLEVRFRALDPVLAPQPVLLRVGGDASVFLVKVSRGYEVVRTDFVRVEPWRAAESD